jgi:hypothetical protein
MKKLNISILYAGLILISGIQAAKAQTINSSQPTVSSLLTNSTNSDNNNKSQFVFQEKPDQVYKSIGPKVKGLSIGMRFQDAIQTAKEKISGKRGLIGDFIVEGPYKTEEGPLRGILTIANAFGGVAAKKSLPGIYYITMGELGASRIFAGEDNAVSQIVISANLSQALFENTLNSSTQDFAKNFMEAYGIPELQPSEDGESYEYTYPEGVKVILNKDKSIEIDRIASKKEIKSSFD